MSAEKLFIIAGPCSIRDSHQALQAVEALQPHVNAVRLNARKPRTEADAWTGLGRVAVPLIQEIVRLTGCTVAMEATTARDTTWMLEVSKVLWLGSKQNPNNTREIATALAGVELEAFVVKNPIQPSLRDWIGAFEVFQKTLPSSVPIILCHRGFHERQKPQGWRNNPDFEMASVAKKETGASVILDPSHLIGDSKLILQFLSRTNLASWGGLMIEADPIPSQAITDAKQQLTLNQTIRVIKKFRGDRI